MHDEIRQFQDAYSHGGVLGGLRMLSSRTSFRFTGIYRFREPDASGAALLENVALIDRQDPSVTSGPSVPMADAYCDYFGTHGDELEFADISAPSPLVPRKARNPALSYCGVVIRSAQGNAVGSLCYFDTLPCQPRLTDLPLLRAAAKVIASGMQ
jgi:hypothetical protein